MANYLYNGVPLPDINTVWTDKETYPFAYICETTAGGAYYVQLSATEKNMGGIYLITASMPKYLCVDGAWEIIANFTQYASGTAVWSNSDIYYADDYPDETLAGTLYLAASEPVPVSAPQLDPLSLLMGWKAGNWVARQRGKRQEPQTPVPVAYVYPQLVLPDIDAVWTDKEKYPYAIIQTQEPVGLVLSNVPFRKTTSAIKLIIDGAIDAYYLDTDKWTSLIQVENYRNVDDVCPECVWTNHAILNSDGSAYLAAYTPVPAGNGMAVYKGVRLPALPEWDKVNNPCAAIMRIEVDGTAHALLAVAQYVDSRFAIRNNKNGDPVVMAKVSGYYVGINSFNCVAMFYAPLSGGEWVATTESFSCNAEDLIWSNFDVADARTDEETVFLAASEPVPVYE